MELVNEKASQRSRAILEFGVLIQPLRELTRRQVPPTQADYRLAIAQVRGGDAQWRAHIRVFTTFSSDLKFEQEFQDISHVPERLWQAVGKLIEGLTEGADETEVHVRFMAILDQAEQRFLDLLARVPAPWQPAMFAANTPFTSYLRIREATRLARHRLHYFDRYLSPTFFDLFLEAVPRSVEVRLVTTMMGAKTVDAISRLACIEFDDYQLVQVDPSQFHDRNLRVDDQVFSLGPGVDRAGMQLTNFGPAENTSRANDHLDKISALGVVIHRS